MQLFWDPWQLWEKMSFVLACAIVIVVAAGLLKLGWMQYNLRKHVKILQEKQKEQAALNARPSVRERRRKAEIPFGVRAIESGIQVEGVWISRPGSICDSPAGSAPVSPQIVPQKSLHAVIPAARAARVPSGQPRGTQPRMSSFTLTDPFTDGSSAGDLSPYHRSSQYENLPAEEAGYSGYARASPQNSLGGRSEHSLPQQEKANTYKKRSSHTPVRASYHIAPQSSGEVDLGFDYTAGDQISYADEQGQLLHRAGLNDRYERSAAGLATTATEWSDEDPFHTPNDSQMPEQTLKQLPVLEVDLSPSFPSFVEDDSTRSQQQQQQPLLAEQYEDTAARTLSLQHESLGHGHDSPRSDPTMEPFYQPNALPQPHLPDQTLPLPFGQQATPSLRRTGRQHQAPRQDFHTRAEAEADVASMRRVNDGFQVARRGMRMDQQSLIAEIEGLQQAAGSADGFGARRSGEAGGSGIGYDERRKEKDRKRHKLTKKRASQFVEDM